MNTIVHPKSFLVINNLVLDQHFYFKVARSVNSLQSIAKITINKQYLSTQNIRLNIEDSIQIYLQNNNDEKVLIFNDRILALSETDTEILIESCFFISKRKKITETYKNTSLQHILQDLTKHLSFNASNMTLKQCVINELPPFYNSLTKLLINKNYYIDNNQSLCVFDELSGNNKIHNIDNYYLNKTSHSVTILPIPSLDINNIVSLNNQLFVVQAITYHYEQFTTNMLLELSTL